MEALEKIMKPTQKENKIELRDLSEIEIPPEVQSVVRALQHNGFEAYIVGGCIRDLLRGVKPKDWDIATNATPEEIQKAFLHPPKFFEEKLGRARSFYENKFFTVTVQTESEDPTLKEIEITTYRSETKYTDKRHPDEIKPAKTLEEDLARRDFTINAMALALIETRNQKPETRKKLEIGNWKLEINLIDPFGGQKDLENGLIRAVGNPDERFQEDALRLARAVRFATAFGFEIEPETQRALIENSGLFEFISKERVRDELLKILGSENAARGVEVARETKLLRFIIPELLEGYGVKQNKHHKYEVYEHNLRSLDAAAKRGFSADVRIAALLHDIAKPKTKVGVDENCTFYNHQIVGAKMAMEILDRLKFPRKQIEKIAKLVKYHMFTSDEKATLHSARKLLRAVGSLEDIDELYNLRQADRIGSGVPKAEPYRLRHFRYLIEKVSQDPISVKMLGVNGKDVMRIMEIKPGPKVGQTLDVLLGVVLNDPKKNKKSLLEARIKKLGELSDAELLELVQKARQEREEIEVKRDDMTKKKYWVT